jgi:hypothetical protein
MGDYTFQEAYDRTGRMINITVVAASDGSSSYVMLIIRMQSRTVVTHRSYALTPHTRVQLFTSSRGS